MPIRFFIVKSVILVNDKVNLSHIPPKIIQATNSLIAPNKLTRTDYRDLQNEIRQLRPQFADAILGNLIKLGPPIIDQVNRIESYIEQLDRDNDFNFDQNKIKDIIINQIYPRLNIAFQKGLLLNPISYGRTPLHSQKNANNAAQSITDAVGNLLDKFIKYIENLNILSQIKKTDNELSVNDFNATAQAILAMKLIIDNLYPQLKNKFIGPGVKLIDVLNKNIDLHEQALSNLKKDLYEAYDVEEVYDYATLDPIQGQISVLDQGGEEIEQSFLKKLLTRGIRLIQEPRRKINDPLKNINPNLDEIVRKRAAAPPEKEIYPDIGGAFSG